jgi:hypothetical protein
MAYEPAGSRTSCLSNQIWSAFSALTRSPYDVVHLPQQPRQFFEVSVLSATLASNSRFKSALFYIASNRQDKEAEYNVSVYKFSNPVGGGIH